MNERDFSHIVNETKEIVLNAIEKHLYPRFFHAIDDVAQETYIRAYKNLSKKAFRQKSSISTWLYAIARNESFRMNAKLHREELKMIKITDEIETSNPDKDKNEEEILEKLSLSIEKLPEIYRSVIKRQYRGMNEKKIARDLDIKTGTVKSRASRGRELLLKLIKEDHYETT